MGRCLVAFGCAVSIAIASTASAATQRFEILSSGRDTLRFDGEFGFIAYVARITGGFTIETDHSDGTAILRDFDLKVIDVVPLTTTFNPARFEGLPLQELLPVDMESLPGTLSAGTVGFWRGVTSLPSERSATMFVSQHGVDWTVNLEAHFDFFLPGSRSMQFKPLTATEVPESSAIELILIGVSAATIRQLLASRRRHNGPKLSPRPVKAT